MPDARKSVGIVGARMCSEYGRSIATKLGKLLADKDVQVISGMALGIDSASHAGALQGKGYRQIPLPAHYYIIKHQLWFPIKPFSISSFAILLLAKHTHHFPSANVSFILKLTRSNSLVLSYHMAAISCNFHFSPKKFAASISSYYKKWKSAPQKAVHSSALSTTCI